MKLKVNGATKEFTPDITVVELLDSLGIDNQSGGMAVAVNEAVVAKTKWPGTTLSDGDVVEIIHAVQGG